MIARICVFCGGNAGHEKNYIAPIRAFSQQLVLRGYELVYGGGSIGAMGLLANEVLAAGGRVIGVAPRSIAATEYIHQNLSELHLVDTMHERKATMYELSDAFIALPGGTGTLEEFFEIWTWAQLDIHQKPCGILNIDGYYDQLLAFLQKAANKGFISPRNMKMLISSSETFSLLNKFNQYQAPEPLFTWNSK